MEPSGAWSVFRDVGVMSIFLVVGHALCARLRILRVVRLPPSIIAGLLILLWGRSGLGWLTFSAELSLYPSLLVVVVFAALPLARDSSHRAGAGRAVGEMCACAAFGVLAQYGWGMLFALFVLGAHWTLHPGFGYLLGASWWGGPGTTAAVAASFQDWNEALSLGMAASMAGTLAAIVVGIAIIHWRSGAELEEGSAQEAPTGPRVGASFDTLTVGLAIVMVVALAGRYASLSLQTIWPSVEVPAFALALMIGYLARALIAVTHTERWVDRRHVLAISAVCVDFLVVSGIGSIQIARLVRYALPLTLLLLFGLALCLYQALVLGPRMFKEHWFEKSMLVYGINTGTLAQAILLLRIVDPQMKSGSLETYGVVDLLLKPLSLGLVIAGPILINRGHAIPLAVTCSLLAFVPLIAARLSGTWYAPRA